MLYAVRFPSGKAVKTDMLPLIEGGKQVRRCCVCGNLEFPHGIVVHGIPNEDARRIYNSNTITDGFLSSECLESFYGNDSELAGFFRRTKGKIARKMLVT